MYNAENNILREIIADLGARHKQSSISKKKTANELNMSVSTLNNYMAKGYGIPRYKKIGNSKNAKVIFPIVEIAKFLADTVEVDND